MTILSNTIYRFKAAAAAKSLQSCPTLCDPIDSSPPGSPVPGILQARTLEWGAIAFSNAWKWKVKVKSLSHFRLFTTHGLQPTRLLHPWVSRQEYWSGVPLPSPQIQGSPCQITNDIFHRTGTKHFTIHMETQNTLNSQSSLEKEEWSWRNQPSWLQIIHQSYSHQDSMVLAQKQKYRPMEQDRKPRNKPMHLWVPYFWQRRQDYTMGQRQPLQ